MRSDGIFRKKQGFTITGNSVARDKSLSMKAKGLYMLIMSYITYDDVQLTKPFLFSMVHEGKKAFESTWNELKEKGYLKVYLRPTKNGWKSEYELLEAPRAGAHTYYLNIRGEVSSTNESRGDLLNMVDTSEVEDASLEIPNDVENDEVEVCEHEQKSAFQELSTMEHIPQKGGNGHYPQKRIYAKGGNKRINTINNTKNISSSSSPPSEVCEDEEDIISVDILCHDIPKAYVMSRCRMQEAIDVLADRESVHIRYPCESDSRLYELILQCAAEMATSQKDWTRFHVCGEEYLDKLNQALGDDKRINMIALVERTMLDFQNSPCEVKRPKNYIKSCFLENLDSGFVKNDMEFRRTYEGGA